MRSQIGLVLPQPSTTTDLTDQATLRPCSPHGSARPPRPPQGMSPAAPHGLPTAVHSEPGHISAIIASDGQRPSRRRRCVSSHPLRRAHGQLRPAPSVDSTRQYIAAAVQRAAIWETIRVDRINRALSSVGLKLPTTPATQHAGVPTLNKDLQRVLSEFIRRTRITLPAFTELIRGQTVDDYRPNKSMVPAVLEAACHGYHHLPCLLDIAQSGARVPLTHPLPRQTSRPPNHKSADERYNVLVKNIRKEQDAWRSIVVDADILDLWSEVHISPFGVVDKGDGDPRTTGRVIHDLSYPVNLSLNEFTDQTAICQPTYKHCDSIATEIVHQQSLHPDCEVKEQTGDVSSAFRHVCIHSHDVYLFGGRLPPDNALVIDTSAAFGWSGSPGNYAAVGGAIAHIHGHTTNAYSPDGFYSYHWVDDHINMAADVGSNCLDMDQSLRYAMVSVLGSTAINEKKFSSWSTRQKVLGLVFDSSAWTVSMPSTKVAKAERIVAAALESTTLRCSEYRSLLGCLRHVATCVRPTRAFLQRLRQQERHLHRWHTIPVTSVMREDLYW